MFEHRLAPRLAAPQAVAGDGKPVRLVADLLDQVQRRRIRWQYSGPARTGQEKLFLARLALAPLGHAHERHTFDLQFFQYAPYHTDLALAAVDQQQVRQFTFALLQAPVAALDCLAQGGVIVAGLDAFDVETPVIRFYRPFQIEHDARRHRRLALRMADIETLDARGHGIERQRLAQCLETRPQTGFIREQPTQGIGGIDFSHAYPALRRALARYDQRNFATGLRA